MAKPLFRAILLLLLLGHTAGAGRSDTCHLGPYGMPLPDDSEECSLPQAPRSRTSPGKARGADSPAKESSRFWIRLGASAQEVSRSPAESPEAGVLLMEGEPCHQWVDGQVSPVKTFHCPTQDNQREEMFCCGTCTASYCCSSITERLDQASCSKAKSVDQEPEDTEPRSIKINNLTFFEFIIVAGGLSVCFILFFCALRAWTDCLEIPVPIMENAQLDLIREIPATADVLDSPQPRRAASATPPPSVPVESEISSEPPTDVANAPWGPRNRLREIIKPAIFFIGGSLGFIPEEEREEEEEEVEAEAEAVF